MALTLRRIILLLVPIALLAALLVLYYRAKASALIEEGYAENTNFDNGQGSPTTTPVKLQPCSIANQCGAQAIQGYAIVIFPSPFLLGTGELISIAVVCDIIDKSQFASEGSISLKSVTAFNNQNLICTIQPPPGISSTALFLPDSGTFYSIDIGQNDITSLLSSGNPVVIIKATTSTAVQACQPDFNPSAKDCSSEPSVLFNGVNESFAFAVLGQGDNITDIRFLCPFSATPGSQLISIQTYDLDFSFVPPNVNDFPAGFDTNLPWIYRADTGYIYNYTECEQVPALSTACQNFFELTQSDFTCVKLLTGKQVCRLGTTSNYPNAASRIHINLSLWSVILVVALNVIAVFLL